MITKMAKSAAEYTRLLQSLLPKGRAWTRALGSVLYEFLQGVADELVRVDARSDDLLVERDTRTTSELLTDHETDLGIPDECSKLAVTVQERRNEVHVKYIASGRQDKRYFIDLAAALGYIITITEYGPTTFAWDVNVAYGEEWIYFRSGESVSGDSIIYIPGTAFIVCIINKYKPAHTIVNVLSVGPNFDRSFGSGFLSLPSGDIDYLQGAFSRAFGISFDLFRAGAFSWDEFDDSFNIPA